MNRFVRIGIALALGLIFAAPTAAQPKIIKTVSNETIEKILTGLDLKFQRNERKDKQGAITFYEFTRSEQPCRLFNYGNDLWLECTSEKKLRLEDVNRWNADAKFSRLVLIESKDKVTVSLESQLDCLGGVTETNIRQFVNRFDEEAKKFAKFAK
jgi:hypothetical protein